MGRVTSTWASGVFSPLLLVVLLLGGRELQVDASTGACSSDTSKVDIFIYEGSGCSNEKKGLGSVRVNQCHEVGSLDLSSGTTNTLYAEARCNAGVWQGRIEFDVTCGSGNFVNLDQPYGKNSCNSGTIDPPPSSPALSMSVKNIVRNCFSSTATTHLEDGSEKAVSRLNVGDRVLAVDANGKPFYDRVFRVTHHDHVTRTEFIRVTTSSNHTLELSREHYIHAHKCCNLDDTIVAGDLRVGDTVFVLDHDSGRSMETWVTDLQTVTKPGAYNAHVLGGNMVVNGIVATHFTTESKWGNGAAAKAWYRVQDAYYRVTGNHVVPSGTRVENRDTGIHHPGAMKQD